MALVLANRVKETTTTTGQGTVTLAGAATGFQSFAAVGNGNTTYYCIAGQTTSEWEVGIGTYTSVGTTLSRDTVLSSSAGGTTKTTFSAGTKDVFVTYPSEKSVNLDSSGNTYVPNLGATTTSTGAFTTLTSAAHTVTSTSTNALAVGANGTTNPVLQVDASTASVATGISIKGQTAGNSVAFSVVSSGTNESLNIDAKGSGTIILNANGTGAVTTGRSFQSNSHTVTSNSSNSLVAGPNGITNPSFNVDASTASAATGLNVKSAAAAGGLAVSVISSGSNENLTLDAKGTGTITINGTATGAITLSRATTLSGALTYGGVALNNSVTGTGSMVLSAGPTFTGTMSSANHTITSTSANALAVGANGTTNPVFNVDDSTASVATGINIKGAAAGAGVAVSTISSGTNENLKIDAKGTGTVVINGTATGNVGIGVASPAQKLDVAGKINTSGGLLPRAYTNASQGTTAWAWNSDTYDFLAVTAQSGTLTISADSGSPVDGQKATFRLNASSDTTVSFTTGSSKAFRAVGVTIPTTIYGGKTLYVGCIYNNNATRWDVVTWTQEA